MWKALEDMGNNKIVIRDITNIYKRLYLKSK